MVDLELWKNEIIESISDLHDETKKIVKYLENGQDEQDVQSEQEEQDAQDVQDEQEEQYAQNVQDEQGEQYLQDVQDVQEEQDAQEVIIQKLDDINDSINTLNLTLVESSIVVSITIILALAFHYFVNQLSKW